MSDRDDPGPRRWWILTSAMVSFYAVGTTFFVVPPLIDTLRAEFALTNLAIGVLAGAIAVPAIFLSVPLGTALDRWSPRRAGIAGLLVMLAGAVTFAVAPSFAWLLAGRVAFGAGALVINLLLARLLSVAFAGRELALAMGLFTGTYPASMIVLFSLHPWLVGRVGWRVEMGLLALLVVVAIPLHAAVVPRRILADEEVAAGALPTRPSRPLVALGFAWMLYFAGLAAVPTFAPEWVGGGPRGLLVTSVITWVALFATPLAGVLIDRTRRPDRWFVVGMGLFVATLALMATGAAPAVATMAAIGVVAGLVPPAVYALPARLVSARRVGFAFGFITALSNLGTVLGPALAGAIRDATPRWSALWSTLGVVVLVGCLAAGLVRVPAPRPPLSRAGSTP